MPRNYSPMRQFLKNFQLRDLGPSEQEIETWLNHIETGKAFNDAVMYARLSAYLSDAIRDLETRPIDLYVGEGHELDYIVPGRLPEGDIENTIYTSIANWRDPERQAKVDALSLLTLLSLAIRNKTFDESATNTEVDNVQGQDRRLAHT